MKTHKMTVTSGWVGSSTRVTYSYRGHTITRTYRSHDVRNKTHNGYWWDVKFSDGKSIHGLATRAAAKNAIDRFEDALTANDPDKAKPMEALALELIFQMTGRTVSTDSRCKWQGDADYQIAMFYLERAYTLGQHNPATFHPS